MMCNAIQLQMKNRSSGKYLHVEYDSFGNTKKVYFSNESPELKRWCRSKLLKSKS